MGHWEMGRRAGASRPRRAQRAPHAPRRRAHCEGRALRGARERAAVLPCATAEGYSVKPTIIVLIDAERSISHRVTRSLRTGENVGYLLLSRPLNDLRHFQ